MDFGILFDIDGVIGRGAKPLSAAKRMIKLLTDKEGKQIVPIAFCTNGTGVAADKAKTLTNWLDVEVSTSDFQMNSFSKILDVKSFNEQV